MELTPKQLKKIGKLEQITDDISAKIVILNSIEEVEEKVEEMSESFTSQVDSIKSEVMSELNVIKQSIEAIEIPIPKDYADVLSELKSKVEEDQEIVVTLNII